MRSGKQVLAGLATGALTLGLLSVAGVTTASAAPSAKPKAAVNAAVSPVRVSLTGSAVDGVSYASLSWTSSNTLANDDTVVMNIVDAPSSAARIAVATTANVGADATINSGTGVFANALGTNTGYGLGAAQMAAAGVVPAYTVASGASAAIGIAANQSGNYSGTLTTYRAGVALDTVSWAFTTTGRPASMTLTPASQSTAVSGNAALAVTLRDGGGNITQPLTVDTVTMSATGGSATAVTATGSGTASLYDGVAAVTYTAPGTAGTYTVTATPGGTLPAGGVTAQNATVTVSGSISTTAVTGISVSAPVNVAGGTNPSAATAAIPSGSASVTVALVGTASTTVRLAAFASTGTGTINGVAAGSSLGTAATFVDVPLNASGVGSTTFTLGGNLLNTSSALRINQVQADNTTQVAGVQLTATQTAPAVTADTILLSPTGSIVQPLGATTTVSVIVTDQFGDPISNATVRAFRTSTGGALLSSGTTSAGGEATVTVSGVAGLTTGQSETYVFTATPQAGSPVTATEQLTVTYTTSGAVTAMSVAVAGGATTPILNSTTSVATIPYVVVPYDGLVNVAASGVYTVATGAGTATGEYVTFTPSTTPANTVTVSVPDGVKVATSLTSLAWTGGSRTASVASGQSVYVFATETGNHDIVFTSGGISTTTKIRAATVPAASYNIALAPATQRLDPGAFGTIRVSVTDVFGNGVPGATGTSTGGVTLNATGEVLFGGLTNTTTVSTNDAGFVDVTLIAGREGAGAITAGPQGGAATTTPAWVAGYTPPTGAPAPVKSAEARVTVGSAPVTQAIRIAGTRGTGENANRVFVEGTTTDLVGETVTPFYRFPGQVGFTAGVGLRTVDSVGNFSWQRKTGKRIAVQFRFEGIRSNSIIIAAR